MPGDFAPDAPTKIMPPTPSLEEPPAYNPDARTHAMNLAGPFADDDPFAARATDVALSSYSSEEAEGAPVEDDDDVARVDLRPPGWAAPPRTGAEHDEHDEHVVEISLSDMDALSDVDELPALGDLDSEEETQDTVVNLQLPDVVERAPSAPPKAPPPAPPLPMATVVERRSHSPAALFEDDPASVTDPRREDTSSPFSLTPAPPDVSSDEPSSPAEPAHAVVDAPPVEAPEPRASSSDRTAARPSLVSQPSGDPASALVSAHPPRMSSAPPAPQGDAGEEWDAPSLIDAHEPDEVTAAPELSDLSDDGPPPLLHKWKVVPTAIRDLERAPPPPAPAGFGGADRAKTLHTVLWSPEDEAAARADHAAERARNPFWEPTDAAIDADDGPLESTEAAAPSDPHEAAVAYIHDAVAYLRSLSHFAGHLDAEVRQQFEGRVQGAHETLRRALTVLHGARDGVLDDVRAGALDDGGAEDDER